MFREETNVPEILHETMTQAFKVTSDHLSTVISNDIVMTSIMI